LPPQLVGVKQDDKEVFDPVIVVTDRRVLDDQIQRTVKQFMQVGATVEHAEHSGDLRKFVESGKKIICKQVKSFCPKIFPSKPMRSFIIPSDFAPTLPVSANGKQREKLASASCKNPSPGRHTYK